MADITSNLIFHWPLDSSSGSVAVDTSGNSRPGAFANAPTWVTGIIGNAASQHGATAGGILTHNFDASAMNVPAWTLAFWLKSSQQTVDPFTIWTNDLDINLFWYANGDIALNSENDSANPAFNYAADGNWHFYVLTGDGATLNLYFDKVLKASIASEESLLSIDMDGAQPVGDTIIRDDIRAYSRVLDNGGISVVGQTATGDIAALYALGVLPSIGVGWKRQRGGINLGLGLGL